MTFSGAPDAILVLEATPVPTFAPSGFTIAFDDAGEDGDGELDFAEIASFSGITMFSGQTFAVVVQVPETGFSDLGPGSADQ